MTGIGVLAHTHGRFRDAAIALAFLGVFGLTLSVRPAHAQAVAEFDISVTTVAAVGIACDQDLSFGRIYISAANSAADVTLTSGGALSSNHPSVAVTGGAVGQCTVSGLQGVDTATVTIDGSGGDAASGGLTGILLFDSESNFMLANIQIGGGGTAVSGGRTGLTNGIIPVFGVLTVWDSHMDFGTYTATLTATAALD